MEWKFCFVAPDGVGADLVDDEVVLASCLYSGGNMDTESDGCGLTTAGRERGLTSDTVDWPSMKDVECWVAKTDI